MIEQQTKRTIWLVRCVCGWYKEFVSDPPRETMCPACRTWLTPREESYVGKDRFTK